MLPPWTPLWVPEAWSLSVSHPSSFSVGGAFVHTPGGETTGSLCLYDLLCLWPQVCAIIYRFINNQPLVFKLSGVVAVGPRVTPHWGSGWDDIPL